MKLIRPGFLALIFAMVGPAAALALLPPLTLALVTQATIAAFPAIAIGFLARHNGMVSFGHGAFYAFPGYLVAVLLPRSGLSAEALILFALLLTAGASIALGLIVVRVHGIAFSMLTLAIGQSLYVAVTQMRELTGGHDGMIVRFPREIFGLATRLLQQPQGMLIVAYLFLAATIVLLWLFSKSHRGLLTEAIRDNEERSRFLGYRTLWPRALVFAGSAMIAAVGGILSVIYNSFISPEATHWTTSGSALVMAVLGGSGRPWGPAIGAYLYFTLKEVVGLYTSHWLSVVGAALIVIAVAFPGGAVGFLDRLLRSVWRRAPA